MLCWVFINNRNKSKSFWLLNVKGKLSFLCLSKVADHVHGGFIPLQYKVLDEVGKVQRKTANRDFFIYSARIKKKLIFNKSVYSIFERSIMEAYTFTMHPVCLTAGHHSNQWMARQGWVHKIFSTFRFLTIYYRVTCLEVSLYSEHIRSTGSHFLMVGFY